VDISNVEDDEVSSIDAMELNVQDSKIGSSTQVICKNEDMYDPQKVRIKFIEYLLTSQRYM